MPPVTGDDLVATANEIASLTAQAGEKTALYKQQKAELMQSVDAANSVVRTAINQCDSVKNELLPTLPS